MNRKIWIKRVNEKCLEEILIKWKKERKKERIGMCRRKMIKNNIDKEIDREIEIYREKTTGNRIRIKWNQIKNQNNSGKKKK